MVLFEEEKKKFRFRMPLDIRWSDMDELGHVNNAVYLTYFEQGRIFYFRDIVQWNWKETGVILAGAKIDFLRPIVYGNPYYLYLRTAKLGNKSMDIDYLISGEMKGKEKLATTGTTTLVMFDYKTNTTIAVPEFLRERISEYELIKP